MQNQFPLGSLKSFLDGYKPSIVYANTDKNEINILKTRGYRYTKMVPGYIMFFQTEEQRQGFESELAEGRRKNNKFDHMSIVCKYLGFPPSAIDRIQDRTPGVWKDFEIDYYGIRFVTGRDLVTDNLKWLKNTYKVPKNYEGRILVIDKGETIYHLKPSELSKFRPIEHNMIFPNRLCPIFLVTTNLEVVSSVPIYNGFDIGKALKAIRDHKDQNPQVEVWLCDEHIESYNKATLKDFKAKYGKRAGTRHD